MQHIPLDSLQVALNELKKDDVSSDVKILRLNKIGSYLCLELRKIVHRYT